ncbi:uncharacterized protein LOC131671446 isoform X3 [Phymastichus coffea]|uniref:uncharacterized protein LOC131671446 isoform X3 n=1 Tax=Phymastichus coffea TaxID=108790 RepID=UPI00273C0F34|nr:uncharacterized protein LOC131671446 isoform X3 [Phymastichus coffea]
MENIIQRLAVPPLTKAQQFLINLLCGIIFSVKILIMLVLSDKNNVIITVKEYYERRSDKNCKAVEKLKNENITLLEETIALRAQVSQLVQEKSLLLEKLRATTNMLRILTKSKEEATSYKTPTKINIYDVDYLLQKKLNKSTCGADYKKKVQIKSRPAQVVHKKEAKKCVGRNGNETVPYVKNTVRDTDKKIIASLPLRTQSKMLQSPLSKKSFQGKGRENHAIETGSLRISRTKVTGIFEPKTVGNTRAAKKRTELKTGELKIHKKLGQTFIVHY